MATLNSSTRLKKLYKEKTGISFPVIDTDGIVSIPASKYTEVENASNMLNIVMDDAKYEFLKPVLKHIEDLRLDVDEIHSYINNAFGLNPESVSSSSPYAAKQNSTYYVEGTGTTSGTWLGSISGLTSYYDGLTIRYKIPTNGASTTTLNINGIGAATIYHYGTSKLTTHYPVGSVISLTYINANGGSWTKDMYYDSTDDYRIRWQNNITAGAYIHGYQLLMEGIDGKFYPVTNGGNISTTNTVSTASFKPGGTILYYESSADIGVNADSGGYSLYESLYTGTMEYWSNRSTSAWATAYRPFYLVGTMNSSGAFILDNSSYTSFLTQNLPTTADGKIYIQVGIMNNTSDAFRLNVDHPMYEYVDGKIRLYSSASGGSSTSGYSGSVTVVTNPTKGTTATLTYSNGLLTSVN